MTVWRDAWPEDLPPQVGVLVGGTFDGAELDLLEGIPAMYAVPETRLAPWAAYAAGQETVGVLHHYELDRRLGWPSRDDAGRIVYRWAHSEVMP